MPSDSVTPPANTQAPELPIRYPRPSNAYVSPQARSALAGHQPKLALFETEDGRFIPSATRPEDEPDYRKERIEAFVMRNVNKVFRDFAQNPQVFLDAMPRHLAAYWEFSDEENVCIANEIAARVRARLEGGQS